jgi:hypothetical protein
MSPMRLSACTGDRSRELLAQVSAELRGFLRTVRRSIASEHKGEVLARS